MPVDLEICLVTAFSQHLWRSNVSLLADVSLVCSYIGEQTSDFNHTALFGALCKNPHIGEIIAILEATYGSPRHGNFDDPLDELIYIKLSQQTNEPKFRSMYSALQRRYPRWQGLEQAAQDELEEILRPGGLHRQRAGHLRAMASRLAADGGLDLSRLRSMPPEEAIAYLASIPGVGLKTAYCVAMYSLSHDVLPVDIHVQRVSERLGLIPAGLSEQKRHRMLHEIIPPGKRYSYHVNCVSHGREICRKKPKCHICPVRQYCAFFRGISTLSPAE